MRTTQSKGNKQGELGKQITIMKTISLDEAYSQAHNSAETSRLTPFESAREFLLAHAFNALPDVVAALRRLAPTHCNCNNIDRNKHNPRCLFKQSADALTKASTVEVPE